jgi:uncharacterized protein YceK
MKYLRTLALAVLAIYMLSGCASTSDKVSGGDSVPGEKKSEDERLAPGGAPGSASVKW